MTEQITPRELFTRNWRNCWMSFGFVAVGVLVLGSWQAIFTGLFISMPPLERMLGSLLTLLVVGAFVVVLPVGIWLAAYVLLITHWVARLGWAAFRISAVLLAATVPLGLAALDARPLATHPCVLTLTAAFALVVRGYAPAPVWAASLTPASLAGTLRRWRPR